MSISVSVSIDRKKAVFKIHSSGFARVLKFTYFAPRRGAEYCDQSVCLSVRLHVSKTTHLNFTKFLPHVTCGVALSSPDDSAICYVLPV